MKIVQISRGDEVCGNTSLTPSLTSPQVPKLEVVESYLTSICLRLVPLGHILVTMLFIYFSNATIFFIPRTFAYVLKLISLQYWILFIYPPKIHFLAFSAGLVPREAMPIVSGLGYRKH